MNWQYYPYIIKSISNKTKLILGGCNDRNSWTQSNTQFFREKVVVPVVEEGAGGVVVNQIYLSSISESTDNSGFVDLLRSSSINPRTALPLSGRNFHCRLPLDSLQVWWVAEHHTKMATRIANVKLLQPEILIFAELGVWTEQVGS